MTNTPYTHLEPMQDTAIGYHKVHIEKGEYGNISKVEEELHELKDAIEQDSTILAMVELSDLYGALEGLAETLGVTMEQVIRFSNITKRAFTNGYRK